MFEKLKLMYYRWRRPKHRDSATFLLDNGGYRALESGVCDERSTGMTNLFVYASILAFCVAVWWGIITLVRMIL
jgi:hypothetical protein